MTYNSLEISDYDGEPVELYEFKHGTVAYRYTSADSDQSYLGNVYTAVQLERTSLQQNKELNKANIKIKMQSNVALSGEFLVYPPAGVMQLIVYRRHRTSLDTEVNIAWHGRVLNAEWKESLIEFVCEAIFTSLKRPGLRRHFQVQCPHIHYGTKCTVAILSFQDTGTVLSITNNVISMSLSPARADDYYNGGIFIFTDLQGITHKRAIEDSTAGSIITMSYPIAAMSQGDTVMLNPGCKHIVNDCITKYNNIVNYGGFTHSPKLNPFDGKTLY